jgi:hypothetical protein
MLQGEDIGMIRSQAERRGGAVDEKKPAAKSMMDVLRETDPKMGRASVSLNGNPET